MDTNGNSARNDRIMVGVDGSENGAAALRWALEDSSATGATVEAVCIAEEPALAYAAPGYIPISEEQMHQHATQILDRALEGLPDRAGAGLILRTGRGFPSELLLHEAADPEIATVVIGAHGHNTLADLASGSVAHALSRQCPKPLVIVPPNWSAVSEGPARRIVVGFDGTAHSEAALDWAVREARRRPAMVQVVLAWTMPGPVLPAHLPIGAMVGAGQDEKLERWLSQRMAALDSRGVDLDLRIVQGRAQDVLHTEAEGAMMLVVGRRRHTVLHELTAGSVSQSCVRHSKIPVCVVPGPR